MEILANNLIVLTVYTGAGLLVKALNDSKLAALVPRAIFFTHLSLGIAKMHRYIDEGGLLPCLAFILPHGSLELPGLILACIAGDRLVRGKRARPHLIVAVTLVILGALVETYLTPFPLESWL